MMGEEKCVSTVSMSLQERMHYLEAGTREASARLYSVLVNLRGNVPSNLNRGEKLDKVPGVFATVDRVAGSLNEVTSLLSELETLVGSSQGISAGNAGPAALGRQY